MIGLVDTSGNLVVEYKYNAWGSILGRTGSMVNTLGTLNPFRYRGYVYDDETAMCYCRSRYYYPELHRFINADTLLGKTGALLSHNLFCYCGNNPIANADHSGKLYLSVDLYLAASMNTSRDAEYDLTGLALGSLITERIRTSELVKRRVAEYIRSIPKNETTYSQKESIYWGVSAARTMSDLDLALSIGHADDFTITVEEEESKWWEKILFFGGKKYKVTYKVRDYYDYDYFDPIKKGKFISFVNNVGGYYPQNSGDLTPYWFTCSGEFYVFAF